MFRSFDFMKSAMLLRHALIRAGVAYHWLLILSMAYVALPQAGKFFRKFPKCPKTREFSLVGPE